MKYFENTKIGFLSAIFGIAIGTTVVPTSADAATVCSLGTPDVTDFVTGTASCEFWLGDTNDDNSVVNNAAFFTFADWSLKVRDNNVNGVDEGDNSALQLSFSGGPNATPLNPGPGGTGEWSFNPQTGSQYMLVFKAGNKNNTSPASLVGYLLNASSGTFAAPNFDEKNDGSFEARAISHISLYERTVAAVPIPAAGLMLIGALSGLFAVRRRRKLA